MAPFIVNHLPPICRVYHVFVIDGKTLVIEILAKIIVQNIKDLTQFVGRTYAYDHAVDTRQLPDIVQRQSHRRGIAGMRGGMKLL